MAKPFGAPAVVLSPADVQYVIITDSSWVGDHLERLRDWKIRKGVPTRIVEMSFITSNYNGTDKQEKVRNFIRDAVNTWDTEYILIGGDIAVVPYRSTYVQSGSYIETDCAADLYYSDLDGSFNADNDTTWGETTDNVDMRPDVYVGRAPAQTAGEMNTFVTKTLKYEIEPLSGYLDNVTLAGEYLDSSTNSSLGMDLIKTQLLPSTVNATSLYDASSGVFGNFNRLTFQNQIDLGASYVFHSGHSNWNVMSTGTMSSYGYLYNSNVAAYKGGYKLGVLNSLGCITTRFSQNDCIAELHVVKSDGGSVVYIGNSRYGWYAGGAPGWGTSERYMYKMAQELYSLDNTGMAEHFALAKDFYTSSSTSYNTFRWGQMALNLIGEPEMPVRTAEPMDFNITLPASIARSVDDFPITVKDLSGNGVKDALVCLEQSGYYGYARTGPNGIATFDFQTQTYDEVNVTVSGYNFIPFSGNISVDEKAPTMIINSNGTATTGDQYLVNVTVSDEAGIYNVMMDFFSNGTDANHTTTYVMGRYGTYFTAPIDVPYNSTQDILYRIKARDNPGNWNETGWLTLKVMDDDEPVFLCDNTSHSTTTGENITIDIGVTDNIDVSSVLVNYWWNGTADTISREMARQDDERWTLMLDIPGDRKGMVRYSVSASDDRENRNSTLAGEFEVLDNDRPFFISDDTDALGTTSEDFTFRVKVDDNIGVQEVFVEWWRMEDYYHQNSSMVDREGDWTFSIKVPPSDLQTMFHIFHAMDTSGNWNSTKVTYTLVSDNDAPKFLRDLTGSNCTTGDPLELRVEVSDNIAMDSVYLVISSEGPDPMEMSRDGELNWTISVDVPVDDLTPLEYHFRAVDINGNSRNSTTGTIPVLDNDPPEIIEVLCNDTVTAGSSITIEVSISDNIDILDAEIQWWLGGAPDKTTVPMESSWEGTYRATISVGTEAYGSLYFIIGSSDTAGNKGLSDRMELAIEEYVPPAEGDDDDIPVDDDDDDETPADDDDEVPADDDDICPGDDDDDTTRIPKEGEDLDQDGMDDLWECRNGLNINLDDSGLDPDGDNFSNLEEFKAGTDPSDISSFPKPSGGNDQDDPADLLLIIGLGVAVLGIIIVALVWAVVRRRDRTDPSTSMVLDDDEDDEIMSWD
ncbi:MAG: C25 family cysteine peptidase [Thermoplasmatota archaeon]